MTKNGSCAARGDQLFASTNTARKMQNVTCVTASDRTHRYPADHPVMNNHTATRHSAGPDAATVSVSAHNNSHPTPRTHPDARNPPRARRPPCGRTPARDTV